MKAILNRNVPISRILWSVIAVFAFACMANMIVVHKGNDVFRVYHMWLLPFNSPDNYEPSAFEVITWLGFTTFCTLLILALSIGAGWLGAAAAGAIFILVIRKRSRVEEMQEDASSLGTHRRVVSLALSALLWIIIPLFCPRVPYGKVLWAVEGLLFYLSFAIIYLAISLSLIGAYRNYQKFARWEVGLIVLYTVICLAIGIPSAMQKHRWARKADTDLNRMRENMEQWMIEQNH